MKICVCVFGFLRQNFKYTLPSLANNINHNFDIFGYSPSIINFDDNTTINIQEVIDIFNDKANNINYNLFEYDIDFFKHQVAINNVPEMAYHHGWQRENYKAFSMFWQIKKAIEMKEEYELKNNILYDVVILLRADLNILSPIDIFRVDLSKINFTPSHRSPIVGLTSYQEMSDHLLLSNSKNISILKTIYDNIANYHRENILINNETLIGFHLIKHNIESICHDFTIHRKGH